MKKTLIIADEDMALLQNSSRRLEGNIKIVDGDTLDFHLFRHGGVKPVQPCKRFKTPHASTRITEDKVTVRMTINRKEKDVDPVEVIYNEVDDSAAFVQNNLED